MSFTYVNSASAGSATLSNTVSVTLGWTPSVGDLLVMFPSVANGSIGAAVSDSLSNTWTPVFASFQHDSGSGVNVNIYYSILANVGSGMSVTFSVTSSTPISVGVAGYTPSSTPSTDGNAVGSSNVAGTSFSTAALTTTGPSDLVVGVTSSRSTSGWTAGSGFTLIQSVNFASGKACGMGIEHQLGVAAGSITPSMTASSGEWVMVAAAFKTAGGVTVVPYELLHGEFYGPMMGIP